jgi:hypothetical protein
LALTGAFDSLWAVDPISGGPELEHAAGGGARPAAARGAAGLRRRAAARRGKQRWAAPIDAGPSTKRRARVCELNRDIPWRRRRRTAAHGGQRRRRRSGEDGTATRCTAARAKGTTESLTSRRSYGAAPRKPGGGDGAVPQQRSTGLAAAQGT